MCNKGEIWPRHTRNVLDASYTFHVSLVLRDSCRFLRGIFFQALKFFLRSKGCGRCPTSFHAICFKQVLDFHSLRNSHGSVGTITHDLHTQHMPYLTLSTTLDSCQDLITQWFNDISRCEYKQIINPDEYDASTVPVTVTCRITMKAHTIKFTQQFSHNFVPFTCRLFQAIQSFPQPPNVAAAISQLTGLNDIHSISQFPMLVCTLNVQMHSPKVLLNTIHQQHPQGSIVTHRRPSLMKFKPTNLLKSSHNVSCLEMLDVALGASLDFQDPFPSQSCSTHWQRTEFVNPVLR